MHDDSPLTDDVDKLADSIATMAATVDATMHTLLAMIRRFDELGGWARQGAKTCAHWLSWRIGDGLNAAREKVRVARALGTLPKVDAAFATGEISFSKVRAITRVARPEMEELLLQYAIFSTGSQLEKICRGFRHVERICENGRKARRDDERYVRRRAMPNGMVRIEAQLTADEADLVGRAVAEARLPAMARSKDEKAKEKERGYDEVEKSLADGMVLVAESFLANGPKTRAGGERNQVVVHLSESDLRDAGDGGDVTAVTPAPVHRPWRATLTDGTWLSGQALLRLACDAGIVAAKVDADGNVLDVGRKRRTVPAALMRALRLCDGGCRFPGCTSRAFVDAHHIDHWARGGETKLDNLVLLCGRHHRAVHEEGFTIARDYHDRLVFLEPRGDTIDAVPCPLRPTTPHTITDPRTNRPRWIGKPPNYAWAVDGLLRRANLHLA